MADFLHIDQMDWKPVRSGLTTGVTGKTLLEGPTKAVLTRVAPGGCFRPHGDPYAHLFHILVGQARVTAGSQTSILGPGSVVRIDAGEIHGYENVGTGELLLLSLNLPTEEE